MKSYSRSCCSAFLAVSNPNNKFGGTSNAASLFTNLDFLGWNFMVGIAAYWKVFQNSKHPDIQEIVVPRCQLHHICERE